MGAISTDPALLVDVPDGVHLGLHPATYFYQGALGSTDLIRLWREGEGWWWQSKHNPFHVRQASKALTYGSALHALLLEGEAAYLRHFAVEPDKASFGAFEIVGGKVFGLCETIPQMKAAIKERYELSGHSGWGREDYAQAMRTYRPDLPCWLNIDEDFRDEIGDREIVSETDDKMLRLMLKIALDPTRADNAEIRHLFDEDAGRPPLAEVSILKTMPDGIRRRWRIDRMFPSFDLDLKTLNKWGGRPLAYATGDQIAKSGYDIQRADYFEGRRVAYDFIREGLVFGGTLEQRQYLFTFPDAFPDWSWCWLFYQKPDPAGRAPVIFPIIDMTREPGFLQPGDDPDPFRNQAGVSEVLLYGETKRRKALDTYRRCVAEYGLDQPWARVESAHYIQEGFGPQVVLPTFIAEERPTDASAYEEDVA